MNDHQICLGQTRRRRGFALLMVVACILLITVVVVSISRQSLMLAIESSEAADRLQKQWGRVSLERAGLIAAVNMYGGEPPPIGPQRFENESLQTQSIYPEWSPHYELSVVLKGQSYGVIMADESAKANLTTLLRLSDPNAVAAVASSLSGGKMRRLRLPKRLQNRGVQRVGDQAVSTIESWGEVLSIGSDDRRSTQILELPSMTQELTVWGDGTVNLLRASDEVLFELSRSVISDGQSRDWIREYRESFPKKTLAMVLRELRLEVREQQVLLELFSARTTCVSVWVLGDHWAADHSVCIANHSGTSSWDIEAMRYAW